MKDELITYETAKLAKEKGFDIETENIYDENFISNGKKYIEINNKSFLRSSNKCDYSKIIFRPTQSLLQRWLREEHKIDIHVAPSKSGYWFEVLYNNNLGNFDEISNDEIYDTYEQALEAGFLRLFNLLNNSSF